MTPLPRYDPRRSYEWNYANAPDPERLPCLPECPDRLPGTWGFCGIPVPSPLGIPAGPLLNGRWTLYYAALGFDVLTYKTVRSVPRASYPLPNLQPVHAGALSAEGTRLTAAGRMEGSWAISFGMPSMAPDVWRKDVEWTRRRLPGRKLLVVSVVGTIQPGWGLPELAADYARCARWAVESGADAVEANLSCPNVSTRDGQLYQQPEAAAEVAAAVREAAGRAPVLLKIGQVSGPEAAAALARAVAPHADALATVNCVSARVTGPDGTALFDGQPRGIGGAAIRDACLAQLRLFRRAIREAGLSLGLVGVGGIAATGDVRGALEAGADAVHLATAAMLDPEVGVRIRREWSGSLDG